MSDSATLGSDAVKVTQAPADTFFKKKSRLSNLGGDILYILSFVWGSPIGKIIILGLAYWIFTKLKRSK
jgi:hypothetical protein